MNTGTEDGGGVTRIGERCLFMVGSHVGHDCQVGNDVTFANNVVLGGHVTCRRSHVSGRPRRNPPICAVGEGVMMAGMSAARDDIIPFGFALGQTGATCRTEHCRAAAARRDAGRDASAATRLSRFVLCRRRIADRIDAVAREFADDPLVGKIIAFIRAGGNAR